MSPDALPAAATRRLTDSLLQLACRRAGWLRAFGLSLAVSALSLRSLVHGGYLFQVDAVFGPHPGPIPFDFYTPVALLQAAGTELLGGALTGKAYALGALFLAGFAPMVLFRNAVWYAQCAAGLLGALNPWVYERMVEGQWGVVVAAGGLFLWLAAWEALQQEPGPARAVALAGLGAAIAAFDVHTLGLLLTMYMGGAMWARIWRHPIQLRWTLTSLGLLALLLLYGVVAFFTERGSISYAAVHRFGRPDFVAFRSSTSPDYGLLPNLAGLMGYWAERVGRFALPEGGTAWWPVSTLALTCLALAGAWLCRRRAWLLFVGLLGLGISASTSLPGGVDAAVWLSSHLPLLAAYREPEKWSALWLLALVVLGAGAVQSLATRNESQRRGRAILAPVLAYVFVLATLLPFGLTEVRRLSAVIRPVRYPADWYGAAAYLRRHVSPTSGVVILPWHRYETLPFIANRLVSNPAPVFFPGRLVVSQDPEIPGRPFRGSRSSIGASAQLDATGRCDLARAVRTLPARWALIEAAPGRERNFVALRHCGFRPVYGGRAGVVVLRDAHRVVPLAVHLPSA